MTENVAILTDSTSDLTEETIGDLPIYTLPLKIIYSNAEYRDKVDITPKEIYDNFEEEIPKTSLPSMQETTDKLKEIKEDGYDKVIAIHISSGLSGTYNMVRMVSNEVDDLEMEVIDSKALSMALGNVALYAAKLSQAGNKFRDIIAKVKEKIKDIDIFFVVGTLKYLKEGGRIGKVRGAIGSLLNIKPIVSVDKEDGKYYTHKNSRGRKKSLNELYKIAKNKIEEGISKVDVIHGNAREEAEELFEKIKKLDNVKESFFGDLGPAMVVHAGPGLIAVAVTKISDEDFAL